MGNRVIVLFVVIMITMMAVLPAAADGKPRGDGKDNAPAPTAHTGLVNNSLTKIDTQVAAPDAPNAAESVNAVQAASWSVTFSTSISGLTKIYQGNPNSNVYVQGETNSNFVQPRLYVSTRSCKNNLSNCSNWNAIDRSNVVGVWSHWHYVDAFFRWYYGQSHHWGQERYGRTTSFYTEHSAWA